MKTRILIATTLSLAALQVQANDGITFTVGLRAWANTWSSWDVYPPVAVPGGSLPGASENFTSDRKVTPIPTLSLRAGDWLVSASHFARTRYGFDGNSGAFSARRTESDVLAGYYVLPTLALTLGYKEVKQDFGGSAQFKYSGPVVGVVASAPLTKGFSLYGNFGYGRVDAKLPLGDATGRSSFDADYLLGEVGVAYSFGAVLPATKALTLTLGYRSQVLATQGFKLPLATTGTASRSTDLRDTTEGLTLGLSASF